jgi:hypothetical protein
MAVLFMDSFSHWQTPAQGILKGWQLAGSANTNETNQRFTGTRSVPQASNGNAGQYQYSLASASSTVGVGLAVRPTNQNHETFIFREGTTQHIFVRYVASTLKWEVRLINASGTLLGTTTNTFAQGAWHYIEVKCRVNDSISAGDFEVYVNGNLEISLAATTDTRNGATGVVDNVRIESAASLATRITDFYITDGPVFGTAPRILVLRPNDNGHHMDFANSAASGADNYSFVNAGLYQTSTYVFKDNPGDIDTYKLDNLTLVPDDIHSVQVLGLMAKDNVGVRTARIVTRSGTTDFESSDIVLADSPVYYRQVYDVDPDTTSAWLLAGINNLEVGPKVQA